MPTLKLGNRTKNILLLVSSIIICLLLLEILVRNLDFTTGTGVGKTQKRWMQKYWTLNALHFRDYPLDKDVLPGKRPIFFLGDSLTEGHGVKFDETYYFQVRKELPATDYAFNLGQLGASTKTEEQIYHKFIQDTGIKPNVVVHQYFVNDIDDYIDQAQPAPLPPVLQFFSKYSELVDLIASYWSVTNFSDKYVKSLDQAYNTPGILQKHLTDINRLHDAIRADGSSVYFIVFPFLGSEELLTRSTGYLEKIEKNFLENCSHGDFLITAENLATKLPPVDRVASKFDAHPSPKLHALVGEQIRAIFEKQEEHRDISFDPALIRECPKP